MKVSEFDFHLPKNMIAQHPAQKRDQSKLMILDRKNERISHHYFYDIIDYLTKDGVLVINDTKVIPARLLGEKEDTKAAIEILLLKPMGDDCWEALTKPAKRIKVGTKVLFGDRLTATCMAVGEAGIRHFKMSYEGIFMEVLDALGTMPLPPYITEQLMDQNRYQTVYASHPGSAAAPTAGLHFTPELLAQIKAKGIQIISVTLTIGLGTFRPVNVDDVEAHHMHKETYSISKEAAKALNEAKAQHKHIVAVGTTSMRTLEANYQNGFHDGSYETDIFIYPGYQFKAVDHLITNFHLPKSTLLMLVSAFSNTAFIRKAYQTAIEKNYRFFSFGDSMFIK